VYSYICYAFVGLDKKLYKMNGTYIKVKIQWYVVFRPRWGTRRTCRKLVFNLYVMYSYYQMHCLYGNFLLRNV